jgi:pimeloyl-ACP methyl ester carboxylesterase
MKTVFGVLGVTLGACHAARVSAPQHLATTSTQTTATSTSPRGSELEKRHLAFDETVNAGGLKLHIHCEGAGIPLVVFDSGLGQGTEAWNRVLPNVASFTRACVYDRANHGPSDRARTPHSNREMARELYGLLRNAGQAEPYVLVGHSMGGTNVQLLLEEHPKSVAGMVLIDASPEPPPFDRIPPTAMAEFERNIQVLEGLDLPTLLAGFEELRASNRALGEKPLVILVAGRALPDPNISAPEAQQLLAKRQLSQKALLRLSSNGVLITVRDSAHHIPNDAPDAVTGAIRAVVESVRTSSRLSDSLDLRDVQAQHSAN